jgi:hypothetical protein
MKFTNALFLATLASVASAEVTNLTKKNYDKLTDGKTVFIKCVIDIPGKMVNDRFFFGNSLILFVVHSLADSSLPGVGTARKW